MPRFSLRFSIYSFIFFNFFFDINKCKNKDFDLTNDCVWFLIKQLSPLQRIRMYNSFTPCETLIQIYEKVKIKSHIFFCSWFSVPFIRLLKLYYMGVTGKIKQSKTPQASRKFGFSNCELIDWKNFFFLTKHTLIIRYDGNHCRKDIIIP